MPSDSLNLKELRKQASENGFSRYWKTPKEELLTGIKSFKESGVVPQRFKRKYKIGSSCEDNTDCRTNKCADSVCRGTKFTGTTTQMKVAEEKNPKRIPRVPKIPKVPKSKSTPKPNSTLNTNVPKQTYNKKSKGESTSNKAKTTVERKTSKFVKDGKKCTTQTITRCEV